MDIHYLRDIPLALGVIALLVAIFRRTPDGPPKPSICDPGEVSPQWMCRAMFYFVGSLLIAFSVLGNYAPH